MPYRNQINKISILCYPVEFWHPISTRTTLNKLPDPWLRFHNNLSDEGKRMVKGNDLYRNQPTVLPPALPNFKSDFISAYIANIKKSISRFLREKI